MKDVSREIAEIAGNYHYRQPPVALTYAQEWISKVLRLLVDFLKSFHINVPGLSDARTASLVMEVLLYLAGAMGVVILIWLTFKRLIYLNQQSRLANLGSISSMENLNSSAWFIQAEQLSNREQWREACRALYLSLLKLLDERGIVSFTPTQTNFEYCYLLCAYPEIQLPFRRLADLVEQSWFGNRNAGHDDYQIALELWQQINNGTGKPIADSQGANR